MVAAWGLGASAARCRCLHVAGWRGGGLRPLVQLALGAEPVVQVGRTGAVARAAGPAAAASAAARALQRRPQLRRHLGTQRRLHIEQSRK